VKICVDVTGPDFSYPDCNNDVLSWFNLSTEEYGTLMGKIGELYTIMRAQVKDCTTKYKVADCLNLLPPVWMLYSCMACYYGYKDGYCTTIARNKIAAMNETFLVGVKAAVAEAIPTAESNFTVRLLFGIDRNSSGLTHVFENIVPPLGGDQEYGANGRTFNSDSQVAFIELTIHGRHLFQIWPRTPNKSFPQRYEDAILKDSITRTPRDIMQSMFQLQGISLNPDVIDPAVSKIISAVGTGYGDGIHTYDCFLSYRVASDASTALLLYYALRGEGCHAFLDRQCLVDGENWKSGFLKGGCVWECVWMCVMGMWVCMWVGGYVCGCVCGWVSMYVGGYVGVGVCVCGSLDLWIVAYCCLLLCIVVYWDVL
jgi:hypothetical protein